MEVCQEIYHHKLTTTKHTKPEGDTGHLNLKENLRKPLLTVANAGVQEKRLVSQNEYGIDTVLIRYVKSLTTRRVFIQFPLFLSGAGPSLPGAKPNDKSQMTLLIHSLDEYGRLTLGLAQC